MITALAASAILMAAAPVRVVEVQSKGEAVTLCASVMAPDNLNPSEQAAFHVLALALKEGNLEYSAATIWSQVQEFNVSASDRLLTIQLTANANQITVLGRMMRAILTKPLVDEDLRKKIVASLDAPMEDDLFALLRGRRGDTSTARSNALSSVFTRVYRPENVSLAVSASQSPNLNSATILKAFQDWIPKPFKNDYGGGKMSYFAGPKRAETLLMVGPALMPTTNDAAKILSIFALGVGKEASMHRMLRNGAGMSYRQEALLWATPDGWRPCLLMGGNDIIPATKVMDLLSKDVETYSESHRLRALAMAQACLTRGSTASPIWVSAARPYLGTEADRVVWGSYWGLMGVGNLTPEDLLRDLEGVKLEELKTESKDLLGSLIPLER